MHGVARAGQRHEVGRPENALEGRVEACVPSHHHLNSLSTHSLPLAAPPSTATIHSPRYHFAASLAWRYCPQSYTIINSVLILLLQWSAWSDTCGTVSRTRAVDKCVGTSCGGTCPTPTPTDLKESITRPPCCNDMEVRHMYARVSLSICQSVCTSMVSWSYEIIPSCM